MWVVIIWIGGEVGSVGEWYSYAPKFKFTEEVMLFLHKNKQGDLNVTSSAKGKFNVKKDEKLNFKTLESGESDEGIKDKLSIKLLNNKIQLCLYKQI